MRPSSALAMAVWACGARGGYLRWSGDIEPMGYTARETGSSAADQAIGWTPRPTTAPGSVSPPDAVLELFRKGQTAAPNTWENFITCGWFASTSSAPWTCQSGATCATNAVNVVGCASGTYSPFFTVCLDFSAFQNGACSSIDAQTGCCQVSSFGACGTYLWTASPVRSMYRCFPAPTVITVNDEPQFVIDAATASSSSPSSSAFASPGPAGSSNTPSSGPSSAGPGTGAGGGSSTTTNVSAIVGGIVGGLGLLALLFLIVVMVILRRRRRRRKAEAAKSAATKHEEPLPSPRTSRAASLVEATTFPPVSPYPTHVVPVKPVLVLRDQSALHPGQRYVARPAPVSQHSLPGDDDREPVSPIDSPDLRRNGHQSTVSELDSAHAYRWH